MIREEIQKQLKKALNEIGIQGVEPEIEIPADASRGDYSSNIALIVAKKLGKNPLELAQEIVNRFRIKDSGFKTEAVKPGFINFWLSEDYLTSELTQVLDQKEKYGQSDSLKDQKVMLEFADPNPFKEFHVGHLRNIILGESFARLLESKDTKLWRVNYQGDVGMHVAKAIYGMEALQDAMPSNAADIREKVEFLGKAYSYGANAYEEEEKAKLEIRSINIKVYQMDESVKNLWDMGKRWSLEHFEHIYDRVYTKYKHYYFESATVGLAKELVTAAVQKGIFEASEGAIIFRGEKFGLHTRVFLTKENYPTYEAKDMALPKLKYDDVAYDRSIIITAHEQAQYFKVVLEALKQIYPDLASKTVHYSFGFVSLKEEKMSSRKGNIIAGEWLLDEAKKRILEQYKEMDEQTAEIVAVGAVKYSMLKFAPASDIKFSFEESISLEGNSGPYIQYTYARTRSITRKSQILNSKSETNSNNQNSKSLEIEEIALLRAISRFGEVVEEAGGGFAPNLLCNYLFDLAQQFNLFYQKHQILGEMGEIREMRVKLTQGVGQVLKNGLYLLGIKSPEKM